jgi:hypothetical protein
MGFLSKRASEQPIVETTTEEKKTSVKLEFERDEITISYDISCEGADKRPIGTFDITALARISFSSPLEWLQGKSITLNVYSGEEFVKRKEDKWGIGNFNIVDTKETSSDAELYLDHQCARDLAHMLNDWRRRKGTRLYFSLDLWFDREFRHHTRGYLIKVFVIYRVSCCVHQPETETEDIDLNGCSQDSV